MSDDQSRRWQVLRRRTIYDSSWVRLHRDDVRLPDGTLIDGHHVVDFPLPAVCVVPIGDDGRILMIEHHRFITGNTGWELPAGRMEEGEEIVDAAARELREETGYSAASLTRLGVYYPCEGSSNLTFHVCLGHGLRKVGAITDTNEVLRVAWFTPDEIWTLIEANEIRNGLSLTALLWHVARVHVNGGRM